MGLEAAASEVAAALVFAPGVREAALRDMVSIKLSIQRCKRRTHVESLGGHDVTCVMRLSKGKRMFALFKWIGVKLSICQS